MNFINRFRSLWNFGRSISINDRSGGFDFMSIQGYKNIPDITFNFDSIEGIDEGYNRCSSLRSIINKNSSALINGKWWIVDKKDNDVAKKYQGIRLLLNKPNPLQSWSEFISLVDVFRQVYGEVFIHAVVPVGFDIQEASALWVINPTLINIEITGKMYMQSSLEDIVLGYYLSDGISKVKLDPNHVLHIRDVSQNINFSPDNVRGQSRLVGLENVIRNIVQAEEAIYSLNKDRGAQGMLINKGKNVVGHAPLLPGEKEEIQREYKLKYGLGANKDKVLITNSDLEWQQMTFNVKDLMLFEGIDANIQRLSDALDYPYELLASSHGTTYANKLEAKRDYYQNNIIPLSKFYAENFTRFFNLKNASFVVDYSGVECLQKSESEKADVLYKLNQAMKIAKSEGVISTAEWRLDIGKDEEIYKPDQKEDNNDNKGNEDTAEEGELQE